MIRHAGSAAKIPPSVPEGQFVDEAAHQTVVHTELRAPAITPHIMVVQKSLPAGDIVANAGGSGFVVDTLGPGIDRREDHAVGAMLDLGVKRIVAGVPGPIAVDVDAEVGVGPASQHWAVTGIGGRCTASGIGRQQGLGNVPPHQQVGPLIADVVHFEGRFCAQSALNSERPLLNVRVPWFRRHAHRQEAV